MQSLWFGMERPEDLRFQAQRRVALSRKTSKVTVAMTAVKLAAQQTFEASPTEEALEVERTVNSGAVAAQQNYEEAVTLLDTLKVGGITVILHIYLVAVPFCF